MGFCQILLLITIIMTVTFFNSMYNNSIVRKTRYCLKIYEIKGFCRILLLITIIMTVTFFNSKYNNSMEFCKF